MNSILFGGNISDGFVPINSQELVKEYLGDIVTNEVLYSTHNVLEIESALNQVLSCVSEDIKQASLKDFQKRIEM